MKKNIKIILAIVCAGIIIVGPLILLDSKYNMRHYFDDWKSETDDAVSIVYDIAYNQNGEKLVDMNKLPGFLRVVYCVQNERIYFSYETKNPETNRCSVWHIASVSLSGENLQEHYFGNLFDEDPANVRLWDLSGTNSVKEYGGLYCNNQIYLHGNAKTVVFDLETEITKEIDCLPENRYLVGIEKAQMVGVKDIESGVVHTVTLESMAKSNMYAEKLLELSERRILSGGTPTDELFVCVKIVDDRIYIVCSVLNWLGESFAVVFKYDFSSDKVYYVSSSKVGGRVSSHYDLAPKVVKKQ